MRLASDWVRIPGDNSETIPRPRTMVNGGMRGAWLMCYGASTGRSRAAAKSLQRRRPEGFSWVSLASEAAGFCPPAIPQKQLLLFTLLGPTFEESREGTVLPSLPFPGCASRKHFPPLFRIYV